METKKLIESLKKKYDGKSLGEVERSIDCFGKKSHESRKTFILLLYYLKFTGRYKMNPKYKAASFDTYALERYNIRPTTFRNEMRVFAKYDKAAEELGIGVVRKIEKKCGAKKVRLVLDKITAIKKEAKRPLDRHQIDSVIWDNRKPTTKKTESGPTKAEYRADLNKVRVESVNKGQIILGQADQIERLKKTVTEYKAKYEELLIKYQALQKATVPLAGYFKEYKGQKEEAGLPA